MFASPTQLPQSRFATPLSQSPQARFATPSQSPQQRFSSQSPGQQTNPFLPSRYSPQQHSRGPPSQSPTTQNVHRSPYGSYPGGGRPIQISPASNGSQSLSQLSGKSCDYEYFHIICLIQVSTNPGRLSPQLPLPVLSQASPNSQGFTSLQGDDRLLRATLTQPGQQLASNNSPGTRAFLQPSQ